MERPDLPASSGNRSLFNQRRRRARVAMLARTVRWFWHTAAIVACTHERGEGDLKEDDLMGSHDKGLLLEAVL